MNVSSPNADDICETEQRGGPIGGKGSRQGFD